VCQCVDCDCDGVTLRQSERYASLKIHGNGVVNVSDKNRGAERGAGMREWVE
jgi:hypothetical protein